MTHDEATSLHLCPDRSIMADLLPHTLGTPDPLILEGTTSETRLLKVVGVSLNLGMFLKNRRKDSISLKTCSHMRSHPAFVNGPPEVTCMAAIGTLLYVKVTYHDEPL